MSVKFAASRASCEAPECAIESVRVAAAALGPTAPSPLLQFGGPITVARAFIYALMCGKNGTACSEAEFAAGCNRFGLDNPLPIITRRFWLYGNTDQVEKEVDRWAKTINDKSILDPAQFGGRRADVETEEGLEPQKVTRPRIRDMKEA